MNRTNIATVLIILSLAVSGCVQPSSEDRFNTLYSTLWIQTAAEYEALSLQAYNAAERKLPEAIEDRSWTAAVEQGDGYEDLPAAIIFDLDETVLDNSFYEARLIHDDENFDPEAWNNWVREERATALEGAVRFINRAAELGVELFYITNRDAEVVEETEANLRALGIPVAEGSVMANGAQPNWTSLKVQRRTEVTENHRVIMIFGDDLNDFAPARNLSLEDRRALVHEHVDKWSVKWFMLPNPNYGSWERNLYTGDEQNELERQQRRLDMLQTLR
ncbi:MAG: 5'-nucleotidase, lipoprotein e(P4) family [Balneolaceae bacterium]